MASTSPKPKKGILKSTNSIDHGKKELEWDEMNILATHHPPDKDYGFMKVDEPPTPYSRAAISDNEEEEGGSSVQRKGSVERDLGLDPGDLASRLTGGDDDKHKKFVDDEDADEDSDEDDSELTEEEKAHQKAFMMKRKMHYNEFQAVQLAKKLMAEDKDDEEDDDDDKSKQGTSSGAASSGESSRGGKSNNNNQQGASGDPPSLSGQEDVV